MKLIELTLVEAVKGKRSPPPSAQLFSYLVPALGPVKDSPNGSRIPREPLSLA